MLVIGIVGAIGAGKTEVLRTFGRLGAATVAADELSREVLAPGQPALQEVRRAFGDNYFGPDGSLRRRELGNLIFCNEAARRKLDGIVHPLMTHLLRQRLEKWRREGIAVAAVESAVLVEMGARSLVDKLVLVTADEDVRLQRLRKRDGLSEAEARRRLEAHDRLRLGEIEADCTIINNEDQRLLERQVEQLWVSLVS